MLARLRVTAVVLSCAIFLGIALLWIRSYFFLDEISWRLGQIGLFAESRDGVLRFLFLHGSQPIRGANGWQSQAQVGDLTSLMGFLSSVSDFRWINRTVGYTQNRAAGQIVHIVGLLIPAWTLQAVCVPLPVWFFFRGRRKVRWEARSDVRWSMLRLRSRLRRFAVFSAVGAAVGVALGWTDAHLNLWRSPTEWLLTLLILLPVITLLIVLTRRRIPWRRGLLWMGLEVAGCVCFFIASLQQSWHWFGGYRFSDETMGPAALILGALSFAIGAGVLLLLQVKPQPVKPGPYCPQCGYCLIGIPRQICPECGRPFTFDELGVAPEALTPG
jgi:hypothetical protein